MENILCEFDSMQINYELKNPDIFKPQNLPPDLLKDIPYFITGSLAFGVPTDQSDIDIAIMVYDLGTIKDLLRLINITIRTSHYNNGFKFLFCGLTYNIIPLHPNEFLYWAHATKIASTLPAIQDKTLRHANFEILRGLIKVHYAGIASKKVLEHCKGLYNR